MPAPPDPDGRPARTTSWSLLHTVRSCPTLAAMALVQRNSPDALVTGSFSPSPPGPPPHRPDPGRMVAGRRHGRRGPGPPRHRVGLLQRPRPEHHYHVSKTGLFGFGTGILAYTLGMRHAFDADHIAAIDNTTRKLVSEGKRPLSVGFLFSLGHSSVVFALAVGLNFGVRALDGPVINGASGLHRATELVGTAVSGTFLYLIAR